MCDDEDDLNIGEAWRKFAATFNSEWLLDEMALASREGSHGKPAYNLLRAASEATIDTLEARLFLVDARAKG